MATICFLKPVVNKVLLEKCIWGDEESLCSMRQVGGRELIKMKMDSTRDKECQEKTDDDLIKFIM